MIEIFQLGTSGMMPKKDRFLASAVVKINKKCFLIDAGEGTQIQIQKCSFSLFNVDYILITHLHADHISGLLGVILGMKAEQKTTPLTIIGPVGIKKYVDSFYQITPRTDFPIYFKEINRQNPTKKFKIDNEITIGVLPLKHGVPCYGYNFNIKRGRKFNKELADSLGLKTFEIGMVKQNGFIVVNGRRYSWEDFFAEEKKGIKISYVTDTAAFPEIKEFIDGSDIAFMEGMYRNEQERGMLGERNHMTWTEVAGLVKGLDIKEVILTHYSPSIRFEGDEQEYLSSIMPNGTLGEDLLYRYLLGKGEEVVLSKQRMSDEGLSETTEEKQFAADYLVSHNICTYEEIIKISKVTANRFCVYVYKNNKTSFVYLDFYKRRNKQNDSMPEYYISRDVVNGIYVYVSVKKGHKRAEL